MTPAMRTGIGFLAAVISVLTFHQGMILLLREVAVLPPTARPWNLTANPAAFGLPGIVNLCVWGGLYGAVFGFLSPRFTWPMWLCGLLTGFAASLVGFFIVAAIKGNPIGGNWVLMSWVRSFLINGTFGLGIGLIFPVLAARLAPEPLPRH